MINVFNRSFAFEIHQIYILITEEQLSNASAKTVREIVTGMQIMS